MHAVQDAVLQDTVLQQHTLVDFTGNILEIA